MQTTFSREFDSHLWHNNAVGHYYIRFPVHPPLLYFLNSAVDKCISHERKDVWHTVARMIKEERSLSLLVEPSRKDTEQEETTAAKAGYSRRSNRKKLTNSSCECCGKTIHTSRGENAIPPLKKFCSIACRRRATRRHQAAMLGSPASKRYVARLKFSSPLYFN